MSEPYKKTYRPWEPQRYRHEAHSPNAKLSEGDMVFFVLDTVPKLDVSRFYTPYEDESRGAPPFDPAMMVGLLRYAYCVGVFSSRKIAQACERNLAFIAIVGTERPDFRPIRDFRKRHLDAFRDVFGQVLRIAGEAGMVKLGNIATDGTTIQGNASRHKAMSYGYMRKEADRLREAIEALVTQAHQQDAADDAAMGSRRGDELPAELARREDRLATIEAAMRRLEARAKADAEAERQRRAEVEAERQRLGRPRRGKAPKPVDETPDDKAQGARTILTRLSFLSHSVCYAAPTKTPHERRIAQMRALRPSWVSTPARWADCQALQRRARACVPGASPATLAAGLPVLDPGNRMIRMVRSPCDKAQTNFTDPELQIMRTNNKGWEYCGNAQASVDAAYQIIVACDVTTASNDTQQAEPLARMTLAHLEQAGIARPTDATGAAQKIPATYDSGYYSATAASAVEQRGFEPYMATGRQRHHASAAEQMEPPATAKERRAAKVRTPTGRALYARRKVIVEPVFGQIQEARGFRRFLLRGLDNIRGEWHLVCVTHNLLKLWRYTFAPITV